MSDPSTYWLSFMNGALGLMVLICCGAVVIGIIQEIRARRKRAAEMSALDREVAELVTSYAAHAFEVPGLGPTIADGEERGKKEER